MDGKGSSKDVTAFQGIRALAQAQSSARSLAPTSGVRSHPPDMGASTLKQNPALMDRLRELAMQSERPPEAAPVSVREENTADESLALADTDLEVVSARAEAPVAAVKNEVTQMQPSTRRALERAHAAEAKARRGGRVVGAIAVALALVTVALGAGMHWMREAPTAAVAAPRFP